jgi:hypothetical protein
MKTYTKWFAEAEGFQGKYTPDNDARRNAITVQNKLSPKKKPSALRQVAQSAGKKALSAAGDKVLSKAGAIVRTRQGAPSREAVGKRAPAQKGYMTSPDGIRKPNNPGKSKNPVHGTTTSKNSQKPGGPSYDKARAQRNMENRLDKEDSKKGRYGRWAKKAAGAVATTVGQQAQGTQQNKGEQMQDAKVTSAKRGTYNP